MFLFAYQCCLQKKCFAPHHIQICGHLIAPKSWFSHWFHYWFSHSHVTEMLYKIFRETNLIGSAWVSVNPLTSQLLLQMGAMQSNMTAKGIFPWICSWQCPLKDEVYQLVIATKPQRKWCLLLHSYVIEWLCLLNTNSIIEAGDMVSIPI